MRALSKGRLQQYLHLVKLPVKERSEITYLVIFFKTSPAGLGRADGVLRKLVLTKQKAFVFCFFCFF